MAQTIHELKTWPEHFKAVYSGKKKVEVRKNDREFKQFDQLFLREWEPETERYTTKSIYVYVTHILEGGQFGIKEGYVVMSIEIMLF